MSWKKRLAERGLSYVPPPKETMSDAEKSWDLALRQEVTEVVRELLIVKRDDGIEWDKTKVKSLALIKKLRDAL